MLKNLLLLSLVLLLVCPAYGQDITSIDLVTDQWDDCTNADETGLYFDIVRAVYEPEGINVNIQFASYDESKEIVLGGKADALIGPYPGEMENVIYPSYHIFIDDITAVYPAGTVWDGEETLQSGKCVWIKGYDYDKYLSSSVDFVEADSQEQAYEMLAKGEALFYIGPSIMFDAHKTEFETSLIKMINVYICFADTEKGKVLSEIWDKNFKTLLDEGKIKELFDTYELTDFYQYAN